VCRFPAHGRTQRGSQDITPFDPTSLGRTSILAAQTMPFEEATVAGAGAYNARCV
jgi:hypothetical protein